MARGTLSDEAMSLHLNFHNVRPTAALRRHIVERIARLEEIADEILAARVAVFEQLRRRKTRRLEHRRSAPFPEGEQ